jgi:hypothetical protein
VAQLVVVAAAVDNLAVAGRKLVAVVDRALAAVVAGLPAADIRGNTAAANSNTAAVEADMVDVCPEVHATCNNRNLLPTTIPLRLVSKSTGNNHSSIVRRRLRSASS